MGVGINVSDPFTPSFQAIALPMYSPIQCYCRCKDQTGKLRQEYSYFSSSDHTYWAHTYSTVAGALMCLRKCTSGQLITYTSPTVIIADKLFEEAMCSLQPHRQVCVGRHRDGVLYHLMIDEGLREGQMYLHDGFLSPRYLYVEARN